MPLSKLLAAPERDRIRDTLAMQFDFTGDGADPSRQKTLLYDSGSFTGHWHPPSAVYHETGYLSATEDLKQPLCGNAEGWGPLSPFRYDFTPCFIDVWLASVAAFGVVFGLIALTWLLRKRKSVEVAKGWQFWTKQVSDHIRTSQILLVVLSLY